MLEFRDVPMHPASGPDPSLLSMQHFVMPLRESDLAIRSAVCSKPTGLPLEKISNVAS
jgi:hypothetical protein